MKESKKWVQTVNDTEYFIEYEGMTTFGNVIITINGSRDKYTPNYRQEDGIWVIFYCGAQECILNISKDKNDIKIFRKSETGVGIEAGDFPKFEAADLNRKVRNGTGSLFTLVLLSLINLPLIALNSTISFPYSIFASMLSAILGITVSQELGGSTPVIIISLSIAATIITIYAILYYFSFRSIVAVWICFALMILDTLLLVGFGFFSGSIADFIIDIGFHAWILWAMLQLGISKGKLSRTIESMIPEFTNEITD